MFKWIFYQFLSKLLRTNIFYTGRKRESKYACFCLNKYLKKKVDLGTWLYLMYCSSCLRKKYNETVLNLFVGLCIVINYQQKNNYKAVSVNYVKYIVWLTLLPLGTSMFVWPETKDLIQVSIIIQAIVELVSLCTRIPYCLYH